jgi:hypothetical protein
MENETAPTNFYLEIGAAMDAGRQRAIARRNEQQANELAAAVQAASAAAVRNGMVDPNIFGEELARAGYASAIPTAQQNLFGVQESAGKARKAMAEGLEAVTKGAVAKFQFFKQQLPVNNPALLPGWVEAVYADPDIGPMMSSMASKEEVIAGIPRDEKGLTEWMEGASMLADEVMKRRTTTASEELQAQTTRRGQDITAATLRRGQDIQAKINKESSKIGKEQAGAAAFEGVISEMENAYDELDRMDAIPSTRRSASENLAISAQTSGFGQMVGRAAGTPEQSLRNQIQSARLRLLQGIKAATGMSAQELNSNVELQQWLDAVTNPANDVESNRAILNSIRTFVAARSGGMAQEPITTPNAPAPSGAAPSIDELLEKYK